MSLRPATRQPSGRGRSLLLVSLGLAAFAAVYPWSGTHEVAEDDALDAFIGGPAFKTDQRRLRRVAMSAEAEVIDAEVAGDAEAPSSVFDGPTEKRVLFTKMYRGVRYRVNRTDWSYQVRNYETGEITESGPWKRAYNMPEAEFKRREKELKQKWRALKRKLRIKHGMGQKWPNGKYIFLAKLQCSLFTREQYGPKYVGKMPWFFSPNEIPARERQMRALELKRRLEQEMEEKRVERLRELGVWPGEQSWRRPWHGLKGKGGGQED